MKIELEEPFKSKWKDGYLVINPENRRNICLVNNKLNRTTISYARYLMCVKLGYILSDEYEVDHKDDDKTNDDINNLQVLTQEQNKLKQHYNYIMTQQNVYGVHCAYCGMPFLLTERKVNMKLAQNVENIFCNRSCSNNYKTFYNLW